MDDNSRAQRSNGSPVRDWIDPTRIYNIAVPVAKRWPFLWGLAIYPLLVDFILLTAVIILLETLNPGADLPDYIGIVSYLFMLAWVAAAVAICRRRLKYLGMSQGWVWLIVLPGISLILFLFLLIKSGPAASDKAA